MPPRTNQPCAVARPAPQRGYPLQNLGAGAAHQYEKVTIERRSRDSQTGHEGLVRTPSPVEDAVDVRKCAAMQRMHSYSLYAWRALKERERTLPILPNAFIAYCSTIAAKDAHQLWI